MRRPVPLPVLAHLVYSSLFLPKSLSTAAHSACSLTNPNVYESNHSAGFDRWKGPPLSRMRMDYNPHGESLDESDLSG
ncbi:MAG TPA: hypothetical protein VGK48_16765 [Terriglobia bacterium]|jgi:hypothetical protein